MDWCNSLLTVFSAPCLSFFHVTFKIATRLILKKKKMTAIFDTPHIKINIYQMKPYIVVFILYIHLDIHSGRHLQMLFPLSGTSFHLSFMYRIIAHHLKQLQCHFFCNVSWLPKAMTHSMFWQHFRHTPSSELSCVLWLFTFLSSTQPMSTSRKRSLYPRNRHCSST